MALKRPSKPEYYLNIASVVSTRSTCLRRQYGAVIVKNDRIIATGYNGAARGRDNCCDSGECWRLTHGIPHGEQYEKCQAVHAEANAIISASSENMYGATLYLAGFEIDDAGNRIRIPDPKPCEMCERYIVNAGIKNVVTKE
jgi:dCMP deaminase